MFCKNCGTEISDNAYVCPHCGVKAATDKNEEKAGNVLAIIGFVFSFLIPIVGLICSILGYNNAKKGAPYKNLAFAGIIISAVTMLASVIMYIVLIATFLAV